MFCMSVGASLWVLPKGVAEIDGERSSKICVWILIQSEVFEHTGMYTAENSRFNPHFTRPTMQIL